MVDLTKADLEKEIEERKKAEEALKKSEEKFSKAFNASPAAISISRLSDGLLVDVNNMYLKIFGFDRQEIIGHTSTELGIFTGPDVRPKLLQLIQQNQNVLNLEMPFKNKAGKIVYTLCSFDKMRIDSEDYLISTVLDITERKKAEQELSKAKNDWERTFDSVPDLIAVIDDNYRIVQANRAMAQQLGVTPEKAVGIICYESVHGTTCPIDSCPHVQLVKDGKEHTAEIHEPRLGGDFIVTVTPLRDEKGQLIGSVHVARNITERKKSENALRESEEMLRRSQEIAHLGSWELDLVEDELKWSDEVYRIFGLKPQEFGATYEAFLASVHPDDRAAVDAAYSGSLREGKDGYEIEHRVVRKDNGEIRVVHEKCTHVRDEAGQIIKSLGMVHDITESKKAEEALKRSEENYRHLLEYAPTAIYEIDYKTLGYVSVNDAMCKLSGYTKEELLSSNPFDLLEPESVELFKDRIRRGMQGEKISESLEFKVITKDGRHLDVLLYVKPEYKESKLDRALVVGYDITERKQMQLKIEEYSRHLEQLVEERTKAYQRQAALIDVSPDAIMVRDLDGTISFWSKGAEKLYGWTSEEAVGQFAHSLIKTRAAVPSSEISAQVKTVGSWSGELQHTTKDGRELVVQSFWFAEKDPDGKVKDILESNADITDRKKAEERLRSLSLYSRSLLEASPDPLVTISADGKITDVNKATEDATGCAREELIGSDFLDYFTEPKEARKGYQQVFSEGFVKDYPLAIRHKSGKITYVLYNAALYRNEQGQVQGIFAAARDITERKRAEELACETERKLKDAERLAAIGATAGMVGHDIRNPLQAIISDVYLAKTELAELPEGELKANTIESLDEIEKNVDYINKIVADLQDYARPLNPHAQESNVKAIVDKTLVENGVPNNVKVAVKVESEAQEIIADPDYFKRIVGNLILNAVQAMPHGGKLSVRSKKDKRTGDVLLTVEDTGVGIPDDVKGKLFTPMVTTKAKGQGFGLAVVKRMAEALGGTVTFESQVGKGTKFIVRLPQKE